MTITTKYNIGDYVELNDGQEGRICGMFVGLDEYGWVRTKYRIYLGEKSWTSIHEKDIIRIIKF